MRQVPSLEEQSDRSRVNPNVAYLHRQKPLRSCDSAPSAAVLASDRTSRTVRIDLSEPVRSPALGGSALLRVFSWRRYATLGLVTRNPSSLHSLAKNQGERALLRPADNVILSPPQRAKNLKRVSTWIYGILRGACPACPERSLGEPDEGLRMTYRAFGGLSDSVFWVILI
jgi:hypothetical protein